MPSVIFFCDFPLGPEDLAWTTVKKIIHYNQQSYLVYNYLIVPLKCSCLVELATSLPSRRIKNPFILMRRCTREKKKKLLQTVA